MKTFQTIAILALTICGLVYALTDDYARGAYAIALAVLITIQRDSAEWKKRA